MNIRSTDLYKRLDLYTACSIVEGFSGEGSTQEEAHAAWQWLLDHGYSWNLQGWYGRTTMDLLDAGLLELPLEDHRDYYGNLIRGTGKHE